VKKHTVNPNKPFSLSKETIAKLTNAQMSSLVGGNAALLENEYATQPTSCYEYSCTRSNIAPALL
jgi:hypothetical protein